MLLDDVIYTESSIAAVKVFGVVREIMDGCWYTCMISVCKNYT